MNPKNTKKSAIHENADANITCDFGDGDISRLGGAYQTHVYIITSIILRFNRCARFKCDPFHLISEAYFTSAHPTHLPVLRIKTLLLYDRFLNIHFHR